MKSASIKSNLVFAAMTNVSDLLVFALMVLAARILGANDFGVFAFAQALAFLHLSFVTFGLNPLFVRDVARDRSLASRYLFNVVWWKGVLASLSLLILAINALWLMELDRKAILTTGLMAGAIGFRIFSITARCVFQALGQFDRESLVVTVEQVLLMVSGTSVLLAGGGAVGLAGAFFASRGVGCFLSFALASRSAPLRAQMDPGFVLALQKQAMPIGLAAFLTNFSLYADTLILTYLADFTSVGLYNTAMKVFIGLMILPSVVCRVSLPRLSKASIGEKHQFNSLLLRGMAAILVLATFSIAVGVPLSQPAISVVFGEEYAGATLTMQILLVSCLFRFQNLFLRWLLLAINHQAVILGSSIVGLASKVGLAFLLIPRWGIEGAAFGTLISEAVVCGYIWTYLFKKHFRISGPGDLWQSVWTAARSNPQG